MRLRRAIAALAGLAAASACGTTVSGATSGASDGLAVNSVTSAGQDGATAPVAQTMRGAVVTGPDAAAPGSVGPGSAGGAATQADAPASATTTGPTSVVAAAPILVGIPYLDQQATNTFVNSLGSGLATADAKAEYAAIINDVNKYGGAAGHRLVPVRRTVSPLAVLPTAAAHATG